MQQVIAAPGAISVKLDSLTLGDSYGGLGFFILEGYRRSFPLEVLSTA